MGNVVFPGKTNYFKDKTQPVSILGYMQTVSKDEKVEFSSLDEKNDFVRFSWTFALKWLCLVINNSYVNVSVKHTVGLLSTFTVVTQYVSSKEDITQYVKSRVSQFRKDMQSDI